MSVTNAETFVLTGGSLPNTGDNVVLELAKYGITATNSSGTVTVTNSTLAGNTGSQLFEALVRVCQNAGNAKLKYTAAS